MNTIELSEDDKKAKQSLAFLKNLFASHSERNFGVRLWDGSYLPPDPGKTRRFTLVINHPGALRKLLWHPTELGLGEAYVFKDLDIEGDMEAALKLREVLAGIHLNWREKIPFAKWMLSLPATDKAYKSHAAVPVNGDPSARDRVRKAISFHYDLPVPFWEKVLDDSMQYSCAYFHSWEEELTNAQIHKLDYICRKLMLKPGETLLDVGCGWGGLILHAAKHYGVQSLGITLSREQAEFARARIREQGLTSQCRVELVDFRDLTGTERFDKIASVGSVEHFHTFLDVYFQTTWRLLKPGGLFLNHGIAVDCAYSLKPNATSFMNRYVFPDGDLVPLKKTINLAEDTGFEVRDVENLREHYAQTLRLWVENLERRQEAIRKICGEVTWRIFKLYMTACAHNFSMGNLHLFQTLMAKSDHGRTPLPATRSDWYAEEF
ncbi:MAG: cyclopropane-fatty-acyl-phospholipid synthase family protein [Nitrospinota bacterium]|nr:cyclopropane-fatty-acyl-phospholipid synthase family protein [Nitrospinota bacterium]